ncbi:hypothetical protein L208DRAFT_576073 [Tricholoma matsutake]|nr:hypothetical protein L208DRAFT_576073 [Tricholoma matsutake 945]
MEVAQLLQLLRGKSFQPSNGSSDQTDSAASLFSEWPDFQPAMALLADIMETTFITTIGVLLIVN